MCVFSGVLRGHPEPRLATDTTEPTTSKPVVPLVLLSCPSSIAARRVPLGFCPMSTTAVESVAWDLEPLVGGEGPAGVDRQLDEAAERADAFAAAHAGKVAALDGPGL